VPQAENPIEKALGRAVDSLAVVSPVGDDGGGERPRYELRTAERAFVIRALWAGAGWPADVQRAVRGVDEPWPRDLVVVARHLSPGSREILARLGANWVDESGQAHIVGPDFLVIRDASERPDESDSDDRFSWSPSALSIAEAILSRPWPSGIATNELATITGWSPTQVSQVLQAFDASRWTAKWGPQRGPRARREIADLDGLLNAWAQAASRDDAPRRFADRTFKDALEFLRGELAPSLDEHVRWAVTGWAAAQLMAPYATVVPSLQIYVPEAEFTGALTQAIRQGPAREVNEGGRIEFRPASPHVFDFVTRAFEVPTASPPRVFADLRSMGGRGEDIAAHLRDEVIVPQHRVGVRRRPSTDLVEWDDACRAALDRRVHEEFGDAHTVYEDGTWSASYFAAGRPLSLAELKEVLDSVRGHETGWPPWWVPTRAEIRPRIRDDGVDCWFKDNALNDPGHADFWRAEPSVRLFLLRGYQEDEITGQPGKALDLTLPIWRVGECLLHSSRMAKAIGASMIRFYVKWTGLSGRELKTVAAPDRLMPPGRVADQDSVATYVQVTPDEIDSGLPLVVQNLVSPLFELFDFFVPPLSLYVDELHKMQNLRD